MPQISAVRESIKQLTRAVKSLSQLRTVTAIQRTAALVPANVFQVVQVTHVAPISPVRTAVTGTADGLDIVGSRPNARTGHILGRVIAFLCLTVRPRFGSPTQECDIGQEFAYTCKL